MRTESELTKLRAAYPNVAAVHTLDATVAVLKKESARAQNALERAEKLDPGSIETLAVSIAYEVMQNNLAGARSRLETRLKQAPTPELLVFAGKTYLTFKDPQSAGGAGGLQAVDHEARTAPAARAGFKHVARVRQGQTQQLDQVIEFLRREHRVRHHVRGCQRLQFAAQPRAKETAEIFRPGVERRVRNEVGNDLVPIERMELVAQSPGRSLDHLSQPSFHVFTACERPELQLFRREAAP